MNSASVAIAVAMFSAAAAIAACSLAYSFDGYTGAAPPRDASAEAAPLDGGQDVDPCTHARWPDRLDGGTGGDGSALVFAIDSFTLDGLWPDGGSGPLGADLDGLCGCDRACVNTNRTAPSCDEPGTGRDDVLKQLFQKLQAYGVHLRDSDLDTSLAQGRFGSLVRIDRWNRRPDDDDVSVAFYNALGLVDGGPPSFGGADEWVVDTASVAGGLGFLPVYVDDAAYVRGGIVVARLSPRLEFVVDAPPLTTLAVSLDDGVLIGPLVATATGFALAEAQLVGRVPTLSVLEQLRALGDCPGALVYDTFKPEVCAAADLPVASAQDGQPHVSCGALSTAIGFHATEARLAAVAARPDAAVLCPPSADDCGP